MRKIGSLFGDIKKKKKDITAKKPKIAVWTREWT